MGNYCCTDVSSTNQVEPFFLEIYGTLKISNYSLQEFDLLILEELDKELNSKKDNELFDIFKF